MSHNLKPKDELNGNEHLLEEKLSNWNLKVRLVQYLLKESKYTVVIIHNRSMATALYLESQICFISDFVKDLFSSP